MMNSLPNRQRGISLFVVMVFVLLTTLMVLWSMRSALFNERVTGNDADYQRAFEAAQALVKDAERDILESLTDTTTSRPAAKPANIDVGAGKVYIPRSVSIEEEDGGDLVQLLLAYDAAGVQCAAAVCASDDVTTPPYPVEFWNKASDLTAMSALGATYGQYSGVSATSIGNPILTASPAKAWYWIEPLPYQISSTESMNWAPVGKGVSFSAKGYVYRITAVARGLRPSTIAAVQTVFIAQPKAGTP